MSSYRRFISYIHQYTNGKKGNNCGFVKIELKNNQCTLLFQAKKLPPSQQLDIVFFSHSDNSIFTIPIWSGNCPKGVFDKRFITDSLHVFDTNYSFNQCDGILFSQENEIFCGTCWNQNAKIPVQLPNSIPLLHTKEDSQQTDLKVPHAVSSSEVSNINPADDESITNNESNTNISHTDESSPQNPEIPEAKKTSPSFEELWASMQKNYPPLDPFEEGGIVEGIKISPSDLPYLQQLPFNLGANRFLLHGYKNYKHLLLGRLEGQNRYILGIPGIYDSQEQFMAKMFGFPCFKPIRPHKKTIGQFGYWFRCIH